MTPLERFELHFPASLRAANPELHDAFDAVKALVEAARQIPRAVTMRGPADTTAYLISDARMNALRDALAPFGENA